MFEEQVQLKAKVSCSNVSDMNLQGTQKCDSYRITGVVAGRTTTESTASVLLTLAPLTCGKSVSHFARSTIAAGLTSDGGTESANVDGAVGGLSGNSSDEQRNGDDRFGKHLDGLRINGETLTVTSDSIDVLVRRRERVEVFWDAALVKYK